MRAARHSTVARGVESLLAGVATPVPERAVVIGIDPGDRTGLAVRRAADGALERTECVAIRHAGFTQADAIYALRMNIGARPWTVAIEKPDPRLRRAGHQPAYAHAYWRDVVDLVARDGAALHGVRFRKPQRIYPLAIQWRGPLGIPTRSMLPMSASVDERRSDLKAAAREWVRRVDGVNAPGADEAEAACIAAWLQRSAKAGYVRLGNKLQPIIWLAA